jgi:hypothetical protein
MSDMPTTLNMFLIRFRSLHPVLLIGFELGSNLGALIKYRTLRNFLV